MFERFSDRARKVLAYANQEARRRNHQYIGTEHVLLGMVLEGSGVGAYVLKDLGLDLKAIRHEVDKLLRDGSEVGTAVKLPQTPRAKSVIEHAIAESKNLNHNYVGTEHLLLGLLREKEGVAGQVLGNLNVTYDAARASIIDALGTSD